MIDQILQHCYINNCTLSFSFEVPLHITIGVRNYKLGRWTQSMLPWDHIYDQKIYDCVKFMIDQIEKGENVKGLKNEDKN